MKLCLKSCQNVMRLLPKPIMSTLVLVLLIGATPVLAHAQTVYVNRCAAGPSDGSQLNPYKTLSIGVAEAAPNSKLVIQAGPYPERLTIGQLSNQKKLTITAQGGPVLVGAPVGPQDACPCGRKDQMCCDREGCADGLKCNNGRCEPPPPTDPPPPPPPTPQSQEICSTDNVAEGWVVVDDRCDSTKCGSCSTFGSGFGNVYVTQNATNYSIGITLDICSGISPIPAGWEIATGSFGQQLLKWEPGKCGRPTSISTNVTTIVRRR